MKLEEFIEKTNGKLIYDGPPGGKPAAVEWDGPPDAPENGLLIPLEDLGYNREVGIFRKSLAPGRTNELEIW